MANDCGTFLATKNIPASGIECGKVYTVTDFRIPLNNDKIDPDRRRIQHPRFPYETHVSVQACDGIFSHDKPFTAEFVPRFF